MNLTTKQIAEEINGTLEGDSEIQISQLSKIEEGIGSLLQNRGSGMGGMVQPNYGYSPYNMLLNSFFGGYR